MVSGLPDGCNLHAVVSEKLINRLISRTDTETRPVRDMVLGANVYGMQTTDTRLVVDCQPSSQNIRLMMQLQGTTRSKTIGVRQEARVHTWGCYRFEVFKPVYFDGRLFTTTQPLAYIDAHNMNRGVRSPVSGAPLVGPLVDRFIYSQAEQKRPQSESIAARKLAQRLLPEFNHRLDDQLAVLNREFQAQVIGPLRELGLLPELSSIETTHDSLRYSARLPTTEEGSNFSRPPAVQTANMLCLHQSLFEVAIEQFDVRGRELRTEDLQRVSETLSAIGLVEERPDGDGSGSTPPARVYFDETDPLRITIANDQIRLVARVRIDPALSDPLPVQQLDITFDTRLAEDALVISPGNIDVSSADVADQPGMDLLQGVIRQQVERLLSPVRITRGWKPPIDELKGASLSMREFVARDGWIVIGFE